MSDERPLDTTKVAEAQASADDLKVFGDGDAWQLLCKASSCKQGWMKSTKAMPIPGIGALVQVSTQQRNPDGSWALAEAVTFVPDVGVHETRDAAGEVKSRELSEIIELRVDEVAEKASAMLESVAYTTSAEVTEDIERRKLAAQVQDATARQRWLQSLSDVAGQQLDESKRELEELLRSAGITFRGDPPLLGVDLGSKEAMEGELKDADDADDADDDEVVEAQGN